LSPVSADIAVTGLGLVTPLGNGRERTWSRLLNGDSGIQRFEEGLEARVIDFSLNGARSRMGDFAVLAAREAVFHADLNAAALSTLKVGCSVSQSKPSLSPNMGAEPLDPGVLLASFQGGSAADVIREYLKFSGPSLNVVAACATGVASLQVAVQWLMSGDADVVLAGAAESSLHDLYRTGFRQMGVLCDGDGPESVRPFDQGRSGFAMGEGAAVFVLEKKTTAEARGRRPIALLSNVHLRHSSMDAIRFDDDGSTVADLIRHVTNGRRPDYINAHGTGTLLNDRVESQGITKACGGGVRVSSTKAATGHLLGAAGAVEAAFAVLALRDQAIPPTLNLDFPDEGCALGHIFETERQTLSTTASLSYGFGGQMGGVLFSRYDR
jgi:3-oxoacyl-[acyl-carrier-protein] synthase II